MRRARHAFATGKRTVGGRRSRPTARAAKRRALVRASGEALFVRTAAFIWVRDIAEKLKAAVRVKIKHCGFGTGYWV